MRSSDYNAVRLVRAERVRQRQREMINSQDLTQAFRIPISGEAGSGVAYKRSDLLSFDAPFRPQQGDDGLNMVPTFTYGFELTQKGVNAGSVNALTGFAKVAKWAKNSTGYIIGVYCDIGVCLMTTEEPTMQYTGFAHLQFTGPVIMTQDYTEGEEA